MEKEFFEFLKNDKISQVFEYAESSKMMVIKVKSNDVLDILYSLDVSDKNLFDFRKSFEYCGIYNKENNLLFNPTYSLYNNILGWKSDDKRIVNSNSLYESIKQDMDNRMKELIDYDVKELFDYDKYKLLDKIVDDDVIDYFMQGISSKNLEKNYIEYNERKPSDIIDYLSNKEEFIETEAREYIFDHKDTILRNMKILEEKRKTLKKIEEDKNHPYYKIREIVNVLNENDCDAVNLTICKNGVEQTFKYDISELIYYPYPYLSIYGIKSLQEIDEPLKDYTNYYELCFQNRFKTNYLETREIREPLLQKYHIGFDENKKRMIFPIHKNCYFARSVEGKEKYKSKGRSDIWNRKVLKDSTEKTIIYVTESIIDALSIEEVAPELQTVSINGVGNIMNFAKILNDMNYKGTVIISFDKDNAGITASKNLKEELVKSHIQTFENSLISSFDDGKDLNECLVLDREKFQKNVEYFSRAYKEYIEKKENQKEVSL